VRIVAIVSTVGLVLSTACSMSHPSAPDPVAAVGTSVSPTNDPGSAAPMGARGTSAEIYTYPIEWTLTRLECPALWADWVRGTGTGHATIRIAPSPEGVFQITSVNTASGTAVDSAAVRLRFAYKNAFLMHNMDGQTFQQIVTDSFNLAGPGGKTFRVSVGYVSHFKVDAGGGLLFDKLTARNDVRCQPI
jgi:hypothetical protein